MGVTIVKDALPGLLKAVKDLTGKNILVGIPDDKADRQPDPNEADQPPTNAAIGYWMEYGVPEKNIPARPFLMPGVEIAKDKIVAQMKKAGEQALSGDAQKIDVAFNAAGLIAQNAVRAKITDGPFEPLSPRTLAARQARGRTGDKPLIDTGQLRSSVSYVVRSKKGK